MGEPLPSLKCFFVPGTAGSPSEAGGRWSCWRFNKQMGTR